MMDNDDDMNDIDDIDIIDDDEVVGVLKHILDEEKRHRTEFKMRLEGLE